MTDHDIINLRSADPFADVTGQSASDIGSGGANAQRSSNIIHIRIQQRSGKKTLTTVQVYFYNCFNSFYQVFRFMYRVLVKNSIKNVFYVHLKRNLHVMVLLLNIMNMAK